VPFRETTPTLAPTATPKPTPSPTPLPTTTPSPTPAPPPRHVNKIAFVSRRDGNSEIYTMNADGSNQTRLTFNNSPDGDPAWSR
jgi:Tol biopolymer transport system component